MNGHRSRPQCSACRFFRKHGYVRMDDFSESELCGEHLALKRGVWTEWIAWEKFRGPNPLEAEVPSCDR